MKFLTLLLMLAAGFAHSSSDDYASEYKSGYSMSADKLPQISNTIKDAGIYLSEDAFDRSLNFDLNESGLKLNLTGGLYVQIEPELVELIAKKEQSRDRSNYTFNSEDLQGKVKVFDEKGQELVGYSNAINLRFVPRSFSSFFGLTKDFRPPYLVVKAPISFTVNIEASFAPSNLFKSRYSQSWIENALIRDASGGMQLTKVFKSEYSEGESSEYAVQLYIPAEEATKLLDGVSGISVDAKIFKSSRKSEEGLQRYNSAIDTARIVLRKTQSGYEFDIYANAKNTGSAYTLNKSW